jgi:hypothetical protein
VNVPPGTHVLKVELHDTWLRALANGTTAASGALLLVLLVFTLRRREPR